MTIFKINLNIEKRNFIHHYFMQINQCMLAYVIPNRLN